jgi:cytochrome b subunit of formate dehydrogenase
MIHWKTAVGFLVLSLLSGLDLPKVQLVDIFLTWVATNSQVTHEYDNYGQVKKARVHIISVK